MDFNAIVLPDAGQTGYTWNGLLPVGKARAEELFGRIDIYRANPAGKTVPVKKRDEIREFAKVSGVFGVRADDWERFLNRGRRKERCSCERA